MATKKKNLASIFVVVPANSLIIDSTFEGAESKAKEEYDISGEEFEILEVTKAWLVSVPEGPKVTEDDLSNLV